MSTGTVNPGEGNATAETSLSVAEAALIDFEEAPEANPEKPKKAPAAREPDLDDDDFETTEESADPDEGDQDEDQTDDGEVDEGDETDADADEGEAEEVTNLKARVKDPKTGEYRTVEELLASSMMETDYREKTSKHAAVVRAENTRIARTNAAIDRLTTFLEGFVPAEPDVALSYSQNPADIAEFNRQTVMRNNALAKMRELIEIEEEITGVDNERRTQAWQDKVAFNQEKKIEKLPFLKDPQKASKHAQAVLETALKFDFTHDEVVKSQDYRLYWMAHYARKGLKSEETAKAAEKHVVRVPQVRVPARNGGKVTAKQIEQKKAVSAFNKNPNLKNAALIDFD